MAGVKAKSDEYYMRSSETWRCSCATFANRIAGAAKTNSEALIVITGPTASGKSATALAVARKLPNSIIISADSMQIYRGFDIGTAKPTLEEREEIPHYMIDVASPDEKYSVARYMEEVERVIRLNRAEGKFIIIAGGTGQYVSALLDGIDFTAHKTDEDLRRRLMEDASTETGRLRLWHDIERLDPVSAAAIARTDTVRIVRFHENYVLTGLTKSEINERSLISGTEHRFLKYYLDPGRDLLLHRIENRVDIMLEKGLVQETEQLLKRYDGNTAPAFRAIGYKETVEYLRGNISSLKELREQIIIHTRQYAKRQRTWYRPRQDLERLLFPE